MAVPPRIRAELKVNGGERTLVLAVIDNETPEHLALKLAAYLSCWDLEPVLDARHSHPALSGQEFYPDLLVTDAGGAVTHWVECGNTALHKLSKVTRRWPDARVLVFKEFEAQASFLRAELESTVPDPAKVDILYFPERTFRDWCGLMAGRVEVFGEAGGTAFNLVVGEAIFATDLRRL